jgi:hypothetical protein
MTLLPKTDILIVKRHVRFTSKADLNATQTDFCFVPKADIRHGACVATFDSAKCRNARHSL